MIKGFIFDLDGVIVFTDKFHYLAWKKIADELNIEFDETYNNRLRGVGRMESLDIVLERYHGPELSYETKCRLAEKKNHLYRELLMFMSPADVSEEVGKTLAKLREQGYKLAIGSSSKNARFILEKVGLMDAFDAISDGTNIQKSKPDPEVFLKASEFLGLMPEECIVVEDALSGVDAAKAGGMKAAGIGEAKEYKKTDYSLETFSDLLKIVMPCQ